METPDRYQILERLLEIEAAAEARRAAERNAKLSADEAEHAGTSLADMVVEDQQAGLGGRVICLLVKRNRTLELPWTRLGVGSPVVMSASGESERVRGVVSERSAAAISIAVDADLPEPFETESIRIDLSSDEITTRRQREALERVRTAKKGRLADLRRVIDGELDARFRTERPSLGPSRLNAEQEDAVRFALAAEDVALIHGPPGTGKTVAVVELILRAVEAGERVLATAPSNLAADNILERLVGRDVKVVRIGHPARVLQALVEHSLDVLVERDDGVRLARRLANEAHLLRGKAAKFTRAKPAPGERADLYREARELMADARRLEAQATERVLDRAEVVVATTSIDKSVLGDRHFDLAVVDEACQSTEPGTWIPVTRAGRVVLAGDHRQLPPTIVAPEAEEGGLAVTLFERVVEERGPGLVRTLRVQYRMHEDIMAFSSRELYGDTLIAGESVRQHVLADLPGVARTPLTETPVWFIDTAGAGYADELEPDGESRLNPAEAGIVARKLAELLASGVCPDQIGVITPYAAQARHLRGIVPAAEIEIDTVDGFQGREKEAIVISLVRSNEEGDVGFLREVRRMNVALTRARRKLLVIGDSATISSHPFYARMLEYFEKIGAYRTVWEEI